MTMSKIKTIKKEDNYSFIVYGINAAIGPCICNASQENKEQKIGKHLQTMWNTL